jgi:hypothetical protein
VITTAALPFFSHEAALPAAIPSIVMITRFVRLDFRKHLDCQQGHRWRIGMRIAGGRPGISKTETIVKQA